jgi:Eco47II restriction endonuclease
MRIQNFIDPRVLQQAVIELLQGATELRVQAETHFEKNVIDPFAAMIEMAGFGSTAEQWVENEKQRQSQKTLQNRIGAFHQTILGNMKGWKSLPVGGIVDVVNEDRKIIAEIKNKYNTMNAASSNRLYEALDDLVSHKMQTYVGYQAYVVHIVPRSAAGSDQLFSPSDSNKGRRKENPLIRQIDGYRFYALAAGCENAMALVFEEMLRIAKAYCESMQRPFEEGEHQMLQTFFKKAFVPALPSS